jgi:four helix bundle protein
MLCATGMAHRIDELPVFSYAQEFAASVTAILARSGLRRNSKVYEQIVDANESILANMDEGFDQESDDGFAKFLYYSKGTLAEVMRRLRRAAANGQISREDLATLDSKAEQLGRMLGGFIKYLRQSGFKDRGRFRASQSRRE